MDSFQFSIERYLSFDDVRAVLSESLGVPQSNVFDSDEYWDHAQTRGSVGIWVMHDDGQFKTIVNAYSGLNVNDEELGRLAIRMAPKFDSGVLIGDHFSNVPDLEGRFVVCYPDGSLKFGYEVEGVIKFFE
ncbi:hypothetical protein ACEF39_001193 [Stenotrophomonas indicatrix]